MSEQTKISREVTRQLTPIEETAILRAAFARSGSQVLRLRLARLLLVCDLFDDVIELLAPHDDLVFSEELVLAGAYLALETPADSLRAGASADRAVALANSDAGRAHALAIRGKTEIRRGDIDVARTTLREALRLDPLNKDACKRLAAIDLAGNPDAVLAMTDALTEQGAAHARLFAARALAHARLGEIDAARDAVAFADFHHAERLTPPEGWDSIEAFNAALAAELLAHPGLRYERYGTASALTWRIDMPATRDAPLVTALLERIVTAIHGYIDRGSAAEHPWAASRPAEAVLRSWCVIAESDGFETWHVHQFGWLSGVYYVQVPDSIANGDTDGGCLAFGLPEDLAGEEASAAYGAHVVRPQEGLMLAFPSHTYHRTFPHGLREKRICLAFDLRPA